MTQEKAIRLAEKVARRFFAKRGNHSEVHLSEPELIALLAFALEKAEEA